MQNFLIVQIDNSSSEDSICALLSDGTIIKKKIDPDLFDSEEYEEYYEYDLDTSIIKEAEILEEITSQGWKLHTILADGTGWDGKVMYFIKDDSLF